MARTVRSMLYNYGIHYGDVFRMVYKSNPDKRVGIINPKDAALAQYGGERQDTLWCYYHDQDFKGLAPAAWDNDLNRPSLNDEVYLHDPIITKIDPYLIQRVSTLIMDDMVDYQIIHRYPTNFATSIIQSILGVFLFTSRNGKRVEGVWDD